MKLFKSFFLLLCLSILSGCAVLEYFEDRDIKQFIQTATLEAINDDPVEAARIQIWAASAQEDFGEGADVALSRLSNEALKYLDERGVSNEVLLTASATISVISSWLNQRIEEGVLDADEKVRLTNFFKWVEEAAVTQMRVE